MGLNIKLKSLGIFNLYYMHIVAGRRTYTLHCGMMRIYLNLLRHKDPG